MRKYHANYKLREGDKIVERDFRDADDIYYGSQHVQIMWYADNADKDVLIIPHANIVGQLFINGTGKGYPKPRPEEEDEG
jgi:hypothetical protein